VCKYRGIFAQGTNCEASKDTLLHNNKQTCDGIRKQGAIPEKPANKQWLLLDSWTNTATEKKLFCGSM
jgi:hypothetical protein